MVEEPGDAAELSAVKLGATELSACDALDDETKENMVGGTEEDSMKGAVDMLEATELRLVATVVEG